MRNSNTLAVIVLYFFIFNGSTIDGFFLSSSGSSDVIVLNNENFVSTTKQYDLLLVMFHVNWCSHCQRLYPEYERAGTKLSKNVDTPIYLAKFDCTKANEAQCSRRYNIDGYPTLRIYRYGHFTGEELNYRNRTTDELVKTMKALKENSGQQTSTRFGSGQTDGVKDEINKATARTHTWYLCFVGLLYGILHHCIL